MGPQECYGAICPKKAKCSKKKCKVEKPSDCTKKNAHTRYVTKTKYGLGATGADTSVDSMPCAFLATRMQNGCAKIHGGKVGREDS